MSKLTWQLQNRKKVYDSRFVKVYEDTVQLPNGKLLQDYTVVEKPSIVMIVATDIQDRVLILREYKHGAGKTLLTLPAGHIKDHENPIETAKRELSEETGYNGGIYEEIGILYDYPSKDIHKVFVVRAKEIILQTHTSPEETESLTFELVSISDLKKQILHGEWQTSSAIAALAIAGLLL